MKKVFPLLCLVAMLIPGMSFAADGYPGYHGFHNPEVKKYISEKVMPVLYEKRQIFENELAPTEKTEIAECRAALRTLRAQEHKIWQQQRAERKNDDITTPASDNQEAFAEIHKQQKAIMERIQAVADMHSTTLSSIRASLGPSHEQWAADLAQIRAAASKGESNTEHRGNGLPQFSLTGRHATAFFLLMEPQATVSRSASLSSSGELKSVQSDAAYTAGPISLSSFSVWPNPASAELVTGNSPLPADNELSLYDIQGKKVLSVENVQAAQHLDISALPAGSYIVQLNSGGQTANRQMVIAH